jgi:predicted RNA methylase
MGLYAKFFYREEFILKTPREIIAEETNQRSIYFSADSIIRALAKQGYMIVHSTHYPLTINAEYKVHTDGQQVVML